MNDERQIKIVEASPENHMSFSMKEEGKSPNAVESVRDIDVGKSLDLDLLEKQMEAPERKMMVITTEDVSSEESDKNVQRIDLGSENSS